MNPEELKGMPPMPMEDKEPKEEEETTDESEVGDEIAGAPIQEVIDAVLDLPAKDLQKLYEEIGKVIKTKKKESAPKQEEGPASEFNAQDMARSFM